MPKDQRPAHANLFRRNALPFFSKAGSTNEGYVYASHVRGGRFVDIRMTGSQQGIRMRFAVMLPTEGFDYERSALKALYDHVKNKRVESKDWLLACYDELWDKNFSGAVKVVKKEFAADDYRAKGRACLSDYHDAYAPFDAAKVVSLFIVGLAFWMASHKWPWE
mgnify:CR=1 FL=1